MEEHWKEGGGGGGNGGGGGGSGGGGGGAAGGGCGGSGGNNGGDDGATTTRRERIRKAAHGRRQLEADGGSGGGGGGGGGLMEVLGVEMIRPDRPGVQLSARQIAGREMAAFVALARQGVMPEYHRDGGAWRWWYTQRHELRYMCELALVFVIVPTSVDCERAVRGQQADRRNRLSIEHLNALVMLRRVRPILDASDAEDWWSGE